MRHWHLNCEVIRKHYPPLSLKRTGKESMLDNYFQVWSPWHHCSLLNVNYQKLDPDALNFWWITHKKRGNCSQAKKCEISAWNCLQDWINLSSQQSGRLTDWLLVTDTDTHSLIHSLSKTGVALNLFWKWKLISIDQLPIPTLVLLWILGGS